MKYQKTALLAGVTALSLFAVSGLASAQDSPKSESSKGATPHATQQMKQDEMSGHSGQNAQTQERGSLSKQGQRAEESNRGTKGEKSMSGEENRSVKSNEKKGTPGRNESQAGEAAQDHMNHGNTAQDPERDRNKSATVPTFARAAFGGNCSLAGDGIFTGVPSEGTVVTVGSEDTKARAAIESSGPRPTSNRTMPLPTTAPTAAAMNKERNVRTTLGVNAR
jgi:hypothetical protein